MRAFLNLRYTVEKRRRAFESGLETLGYEIIPGVTRKPEKGDIFVTWNRIGTANGIANLFEDKNLPVLVAENATWGNRFAEIDWYHIARGHHNTAGCFPVGDGNRWDSLGVNLQPFRHGGETLILAQRGIGSPPVVMPRGWPERLQKKTGWRLRGHPGNRPEKIALEEDLEGISRVATWGSGAAIKALILGVEVKSYYKNWIGEQDNTEAGRLAMFRRLAWAQWRLDEISTGLPFRRLL